MPLPGAAVSWRQSIRAGNGGKARKGSSTGQRGFEPFAAAPISGDGIVQPSAPAIIPRRQMAWQRPCRRRHRLAGTGLKAARALLPEPWNAGGGLYLARDQLPTSQSSLSQGFIATPASDFVAAEILPRCTSGMTV